MAFGTCGPEHEPFSTLPLPPSFPLIIFLKWCVAGERDGSTDSLYNGEELRESGTSVAYHSQWEDSARISTAAGAAVIYCNYVNPLKEPETVELVVKSARSELFVSVTTVVQQIYLQEFSRVSQREDMRKNSATPVWFRACWYLLS